MPRRRTGDPLTLAPDGPARPDWAWTSSRHGVVSAQTAAQAERFSSTLRRCFSPWERLTREPPNTMLPVVRRTCPAPVVSPTEKKTALGRKRMAEATHAAPLPLIRRGVRRAKAPFCQYVIDQIHDHCRGRHVAAMSRHIPSRPGPRQPEVSDMINLVKQLTVGFHCSSVWHEIGFTSAFPTGEQRNPNGLPLHQRVLGSSPRRLTTPAGNGGKSFRSLFVSHTGYYIVAHAALPQTTSAQIGVSANTIVGSYRSPSCVSSCADQVSSCLIYVRSCCAPTAACCVQHRLYLPVAQTSFESVVFVAPALQRRRRRGTTWSHPVE
jgi:hypothetical protein